MDREEATKVVIQRIQELDPENAPSIISCFLLKGQTEPELVRLAHAPNLVIQSLVRDVTRELCLPLNPTLVGPASPSPYLPTNFSFSPPALSLENVQQMPQVLTVQQPQLLPSGNRPGYYKSSGLNPNAQSYIPLAAKHPSPNQQSQSSSRDIRPQSSNQASLQICADYSNGVCHLGTRCRFLHLLEVSKDHIMVVNRKHNVDINAVTSPNQLEKQLFEILKLRRGIPVPLSCLSILYQERFGKDLPVQTCITESHKFGKLCCGLTKLIARMKNSIRQTDKPHGMSSIILVDDFSRYMKFVDDRQKQGPSSACECQVYVTFPAQSRLRARDLQDYFAVFGAIQEVRIPSQWGNLYGFITFVYPETASLVLSKTNPHYICGVDVTAKPFQQRPMLDKRTEKDKQVQDPDNEPRIPPT